MEFWTPDLDLAQSHLGSEPMGENLSLSGCLPNKHKQNKCSPLGIQGGGDGGVFANSQVDNSHRAKQGQGTLTGNVCEPHGPEALGSGSTPAGSHRGSCMLPLGLSLRPFPPKPCKQGQ